MDTKQEILSRYFGYTGFRGGQEELIDAQLSGRDAFGIMPTGGGKSLCYQIPAVILPGITLVISPLISLMRDQVLALKSAGIPAAYINSSLTMEQIRRVYQNLRMGRYKIVYVAPERLLSGGFLALAQELNISLVAVDEAHCISQWGQDFRPSYLKIPEFLEKLPRRPILSAFTATATPLVRQDIIRILHLQFPLEIVTGFDRPNLRFEVRTPESKKEALLTFLALRKDRSGIVYCSTRKDVEEICSLLQSKRFAATRYHAGLSDEERLRNQEDFLNDRRTIMVATNAFGMGIDKSNVSYVIHYNMPLSLEAYYQEAGRAGRDGEQAECILLFKKKDILTARFLIQKSYEDSELPEEERAMVREQDLKRLYQMIDYCQTAGCLRRYILAYFGQRQTGRCGNCGNCTVAEARRKPQKAPAAPVPTGRMTTKDITREAQMVLSCIRRISDALGHSSTVTMTVLVLRGSRDKRLLEMKLDGLSTYGLMASFSREEIRAIIAHLEDAGLITCDKHEIVCLTPTASGVLFRGERVILHLDEAEMEAKFPQSGSVQTDSRLLLALKTLRARLAKEEQVPAYVIFSNATLDEMAAKEPKTMDQLLAVSGVGEAKAKRYGRAFLAEIRKYGG
ncbi:MAG: DNA helicase RecQ [Candidatus Faecousia sp.]|nr:DNA helicase RecQ [Candidatus Faecousia sp.]